MAGGDELVRVTRNKKCYIKISTTEHCARTVLSIHALGRQNKYTITFFSGKEIFVEKKIIVTKWIKSCLLPCFGTFKMPILMFISILVFRPEGRI